MNKRINISIFYFFSLFGLIFISGIPLFNYIRIFKLAKYLFILLVSFFCFYKSDINKSILLPKYVLFFLLSYIPSLFVSYFISPDLFSANLGSLFSIFLLFLIFFSNFLDLEICHYVRLSINCVAWFFVLWAVIQFFFYRMNLNLNNILFLVYFKAYDITDLSRQVYMPNNPIIPYRLTGLAMDPFYLGFYCNYIIFTSKRKFIKIIPAVVLIFSFSRSNLLGFIIYVCYVIYKRRNSIKEKKLFDMIIISFFIILIPLLVFFVFNIQGKGTTRNHRIYYFLLPIEIFAKYPFLSICGGSPLLTGGMFHYFSDLPNFENLPSNFLADYAWAIECDWAGIFVGRGFFGILTYVFLIYRNLKANYIPICERLFSLAIFIGGVGYDLTSLILVILWLGLVEKEDLLKKEYYRLQNNSGQFKYDIN